MVTKIKSAKIVKNTKLSAHLIEEHAKSTKDFDMDIHPDLKKSFEVMGSHLAVMCGYIMPEDVEDIKTGVVDDFFVRAFSISKDESGIVLTGYHLNPEGQAVQLNTPFRRFEEANETRYIFMDDLIEKLEKAKEEVRKYIFEGKKADDAQGKLFTENESA